MLFQAFTQSKRTAFDTRELDDLFDCRESPCCVETLIGDTALREKRIVSIEMKQASCKIGEHRLETTLAVGSYLVVGSE